MLFPKKNVVCLIVINGKKGIDDVGQSTILSVVHVNFLKSIYTSGPVSWWALFLLILLIESKCGSCSALCTYLHVCNTQVFSINLMMLTLVYWGS